MLIEMYSMKDLQKKTLYHLLKQHVSWLHFVDFSSNVLEQLVKSKIKLFLEKNVNNFLTVSDNTQLSDINCTAVVNQLKQFFFIWELDIVFNWFIFKI